MQHVATRLSLNDVVGLSAMGALPKFLVGLVILDGDRAVIAAISAGRCVHPFSIISLKRVCKALSSI